MILFENEEISTILAALKFYRREMKEGLVPYGAVRVVDPTKVEAQDADIDFWFLETATDGYTHEAYDAEGIDELIEKILKYRRP